MNNPQHMATDAPTDYERLGNQLEEAASTLRKSRRRVRVATSDVNTGITISAKPAEVGSDRAGLDPVGEPSADLNAEGASVPDGPVVPEELLSGISGTTGEDGAAGEAEVDLASLEALMFSSRHPLTAARVGELVAVPAAKALRRAVAELNRQYEATGRSFRIELVAGGYQMLTLPVFGELLNKLHQRDVDSKLSRSALETLAIVAYKQPVLRAEVEAIRGVASGETIRSLMEKHLVKIAGRAEEPGRPILYGTTKRFLELFGLNSIKDLPKEDQAKPTASEAV